jgi:hypothetical protein
LRCDFFEQVPGHIFGSWVIREFENPVGFTASHRAEGVGVLFPKEKGVIPMAVDPPFAPVLEEREIDRLVKGVLPRGRKVKFGDVIVSMKVLASPVMSEQAMSGTERDSLHDSKRQVQVLRLVAGK